MGCWQGGGAGWVRGAGVGRFAGSYVTGLVVGSGRRCHQVAAVRCGAAVRGFGWPVDIGSTNHYYV